MAASTFVGVGSGEPRTTVHSPSCTAAGFGQSFSSLSRAICSVCGRSMPVTKAGLLRVHGPLGNRCTGSGMLIVSPSSSITATSATVSVGSTTSTGVTSDVTTVNSFRPTSVRIVKRIPRASRHLTATKLASILMGVTTENDVESWIRLFNFSSRCLAVPRRGGHRRSLASLINAQLQEERNSVPSQLHRSSYLQSTSNRVTTANLAKRVSSKLEDGDFRGAVRIACSQDSLAPMSEETLSSLRAKHPRQSDGSCLPPAPQVDTLLMPLAEGEIMQAIRSFPCGSAGGPDGLRPQHLVDLTSASAERGGRELISALSSFIHHVLEGHTPSSIQPVFFGANLIALNKKEGGIRPIAVGNTLRRLASKCACPHILSSLEVSLAPRQLGYGTPMGSEAAVHAARCYLESMSTSSNKLMLKLDFRNAFNSLRRDKMLFSVSELAPTFYQYILSSYGKPSCLYCGDHIIQSAEGVQQGDPVGPLLFCLSIHQLVSKLQSELVLFYLDDGTIAGSLQDVLADLRLIEFEASKLGLELNHSKSEVITDQPSVQEAMLSEVPGLRTVSCSQATLLGSPIGDIECINTCILSKVDLLKVMGERLSLLCSHDALILLRHSFSLPKVLYILRTAPCFLSCHLQSFDDVLRSILSLIVNVPLGSDSAWLQASLPVKAGGIGIRRSTQLAPSAYLASAAGCSDLVQQILPPYLSHNVGHSHYYEAALSLWAENHSYSPPSQPSASRQRVWDAPKIEASIQSLWDLAISDVAKARLLAVSCAESGAWLNALPLSSIGLRMDDDVVRIAVGLRLGLPLCSAHTCSGCGGDVLEDGIHGLSCRYSRGRHSRHAALNDIVKRSLDAAKIPSHLEPSGLYRADGKRPDGASVVPWQRG